MKKALILLTSITFLTTTILHTISCSDNFLEINNDDIYDSPGSTGKINNTALIYMYALPKNEQPDHSKESFIYWKWDLENRKKIIGSSHALTLNNPKTEYWKIIMQKTKNNGIFVSSHKKSYESIN